MLIVQVCDFGNDGDAEYRMHAPVRELGKQPEIATIDCHFAHRCLPMLAETADVLIVQFINDWELLALCQRRRRAGLVTVFEANDDFFDLQPWSPIADAWLDRTVQELYLKWLVLADGVQTSTAELARRWRDRGANEVAVFPNQLVIIDPLQEVLDRPLTVGWGGSPGHFADWYQLAPHLTRWLKAHPDVHLAVMTNELAHSFVSLEPHRYHFTGFGSLNDYVKFLRSLDIGLAPLLPTNYNRGRSDVKFLEYASQGVAGIYADFQPYQSSVVHGVTGLLSRSPSEMIEQLELLRTNPALRLQLRQQAYEYLQSNRLLGDNVDERVRWYKTLLKREPDASRQLPRYVAEVSTSRDDNYWQLRPQEPERAFLSTMQPSDKRAAAESLNQLAQREPNYVGALAHQGLLLNDVRDHHQALNCLQRALSLAPQSPRVLSELGRTWFLLDDSAQAIHYLEEAIEAEANYLPAWQYLLRLLSLHKPSDCVMWGRRAEEQFPTCYSLVFLAAQLYPPAEAITVLHRVVDRIPAMIVAREKSTAMRAFRQAFEPAIRANPEMPAFVPLLQRACEVFPESAWLANELGNALHRTGESHEALACHARAFHLWQDAEIFRDEFPTADTARWPWIFADHIQRHDCAMEGFLSPRPGVEGRGLGDFHAR